ncbi:MAG TPA: hypothetical protein VFU94_07465 [Conexibacter sp.]|nr:hypothetical protein [Conexibacter sp.]
MRILLKARPNSSNALYRSVLPMSALMQRGHEVRSLQAGAKSARADQLAGVDVLQIHRYCDKETQALVHRARDRGVCVVWDEDDDVVAFRDTLTYRDVSRVVWERRRASIDRVLGLADLVTTPSAELAERFRDRGARKVSVIDNYVPSLFLQAQAQGEFHGGVTIGWVAAAEHLYDADQLQIRSVLQRILDARPDVRVVTVGIPLRIESDRYSHVRPVPLIKYGHSTTHGGDPTATKVVKMEPVLGREVAQFDIGIAPLANAPFNTTRSKIKLKEYAAGGAAWLASPFGPYVGMGEKQGGRLVADDQWYEALMRLIDNPRERRKLAKRATRWVTDQTIEKNANLWEEALREALDSAQSR